MKELFPECQSLFISKDEHLNYYETLEEYFKRPMFQDAPKEWIDECIKADSIWEIQIYPETPMGFYNCFAPSLGEAIQRIWSYSIDEEKIRKEEL